MIQNIFCNLCNSLRGFKCFLSVNIKDHFIVYIRFYSHCFMIFYLERKNIFIINGIHNCICMKLVPKGLLRSCKLRIFHGTGIRREYRCSCKTKHIIFLKAGNNCSMHITKLTAVTLIKNYDYLLIKSRVIFRIFLNES